MSSCSSSAGHSPESASGCTARRCQNNLCVRGHMHYSQSGNINVFAQSHCGGGWMQVPHVANQVWGLLKSLNLLHYVMNTDFPKCTASLLFRSEQLATHRLLPLSPPHLIFLLSIFCQCPSLPCFCSVSCPSVRLLLSWNTSVHENNTVSSPC